MKSLNKGAQSYVLSTEMGQDVTIEYVPKPERTPFSFGAIAVSLIWLIMWFAVIVTPAAGKSPLAIILFTAFMGGMAYASHRAFSKPKYETDKEYFASVTVHNFGPNDERAKNEIVHLLGLGRVPRTDADEIIRTFEAGPIGFLVASKTESGLKRKIQNLETKLLNLEVEFDFFEHDDLDYTQYFVVYD